MTKHRHLWREIDRCCAWCAKCEAVKYHNKIERDGE